MLSTALLTFIYLVTISGTANCPSNWKPPEMHGIRLGMTVQQVKSRLPFLEISNIDEYEVQWTSLIVTKSKKIPRERLPKVFEIEMWFWKTRLVRFNIQYYGSNSPESVSQFVDLVVRGFALSDEMQVYHRYYECGNIGIAIGRENKRTVSLVDLRAEEILNKRVEDSYKKSDASTSFQH